MYPLLVFILLISPIFVSSLNAHETIVLLFSFIPGRFESNSPILLTGFDFKLEASASSTKSVSLAAISNFVAFEKTSFIVFSDASIFLTIVATLIAF